MFVPLINLIADQSEDQPLRVSWGSLALAEAEERTFPDSIYPACTLIQDQWQSQQPLVKLGCLGQVAGGEKCDLSVDRQH
jgi:hypothetical protein